MDWAALVAKHLEVEEVERQLQVVKGELADMHREVLAEFEESKVTSVKHGGFTITKYTTLRASALDGDQQALNHALRVTGNGSIIQERANPKTFEKLVRDYLKTDGQLPDALEAATKVYAVTDLRLRRS
jgi:hypothetical protein